MFALKVRTAPTGYQMIESLEVKNFRCFENLQLNGLRRINIVVGPNASGKTALLEGILLGARATPQAALVINQSRNLPTPPTSLQVGVQIALPIAPTVFSSIWDNLFFFSDSRRAVHIKYYDSQSRSFSLKIAYSSEQIIAPQQGIAGTSPGLAPTVVPILFTRDSQAEHTVLRATLNAQNQITYEAATDLGPASAIFPSVLAYSAQDNALWFSQLSEQGREKEVNEILQREFEYLGDLSVLSPHGIPALYASVGGTAKLPVTLISTGIHKFITLILASISYKDGIVLVDEVENGMYFDRLPALWTVLHRLAVENNSQIFVSTHSRECLGASLPIIKEDPGAFALIQMGRNGRGCSARIFSGYDFMKALEQDAEVR